GAWRLYAFLFSALLLGLLGVTAVAFRRRWPVFSGAAHAIGSLPWFKNLLDGKQSVIDSAERNLFSFYHETPKAFWASLILNLACHGRQDGTYWCSRTRGPHQVNQCRWCIESWKFRDL